MTDVSVTKDWYLTYIKHRDIMENKLKDIKDEGEKVIVNYKDKSLTAIIMPVINGIDTLFSELDKGGEVTLVTLNTKKNLKAVIGSWEKLVNHPKFKIIFANPYTHEKWIIYPYTHNRISQKPEKGLKSLFETVEEVQKV